MTDKEVSQRTGELLKDYFAAKRKVELAKLEATREAKVLEGIVEYLRTGGKSGQIAPGMPPDTYLSTKVAKVFSDLRESLQEKESLNQSLSGMGYPQAD